MLSVRGLAKSTAFERVNTLKWLMYLAMDEGWIRKHPFKKFECRPEYKKRPFLSEEDIQRVIHVKLARSVNRPSVTYSFSCASAVWRMRI